jgi:hypothetical protein
MSGRKNNQKTLDTKPQRRIGKSLWLQEAGLANGVVVQIGNKLGGVQ